MKTKHRDDMVPCGACTTKPFVVLEESAAQAACFCGVRGMRISQEVNPDLSPERREELAVSTWNRMWRRPPGEATREIIHTLNWMIEGSDSRLSVTAKFGDVEEHIGVDRIESAAAECGIEVAE